jgi:3-isopropylmalate/(R)-2-methylmalate dehydratase small subunit
MPKSLFEKIWDEHVVRDLGGGWALLHIDRHLLHDLSGPPALATLAKRGLSVRNPELVFATPDHAVSSAPSRTAQTFELGDYALEALRYRPDGSRNPDCVLNEPRFRTAPIILAGRNFGCGSSREGAVTALMAMGVRSVIAPSFGDIFYGNCIQNGLLPVVLPEVDVDRLAALSRSGDVIVDLERCIVTTPENEAIAFAIDPLRREMLLEGLDEIGLTLKSSDTIAAWQTDDRARRPWVWNVEERAR